MKAPITDGFIKRTREYEKQKKLSYKKSIPLEMIDKYLVENHNHIDDVAVVIDSIAFQKRCHKVAK